MHAIVHEQKEVVFRKIAVAVAFSPRIEAILAESKALKSHFGSQMLIIHVGQKNMQQEQYLKHLLHRFELDGPNDQLIWREGDAVDHILDVCVNEDVDLIVAGALEKESLVKYFMGSVARKLSRNAPCSILMLTEPSIKSRGFEKIVVEGSDHPKTSATIATAIGLAKRYKANEVDIIQEFDPQKMALIRSDELRENEADKLKEELLEEENRKLDEILSCTDCGNLQLKTERFEGKPGYMITKYARENKADLLVLNSPDKKMNILDRVFPHDIEFALSDLPCNLLIVHPKNEAELH